MIETAVLWLACATSAFAAFRLYQHAVNVWRLWSRPDRVGVVEPTGIWNEEAALMAMLAASMLVALAFVLAGIAADQTDRLLGTPVPVRSKKE